MSAAVAAVALFSVAAVAETGPTDWSPVSTNGIAAWSKERSAPGYVVTDKSAGTVVFLAEATGLNLGDTAEFLVCGPLSDRAYESMFMSLAKPEDIVAAVASLDVPRGVPTNNDLARFWPEGEHLGISVRPVGGEELELGAVIKDEAGNGENVVGQGIVFTGGELAADGSLVAATNIPCAILAMYSHSPSPLQLPAALEQSSTYGRIQVGRKFKRGDLVEISLKRKETDRVREFVCSVSPATSKIVDGKGAVLCSGTFTEAAEYVRAESKKGLDIFLRLAFSPDTPIAFAKACAGLFVGFDGTVAKLNGFEKGQFFAKAFLPDDSWRNRKQRIAQPFEIYPAGNGAGKFVFVEEHWDKDSDSIDPELRPHEHEYKSKAELLRLVAETGKQGDKMFTAFVFLPTGSTIGPALEVVNALRPRITCFYVFEGIERQADGKSGETDEQKSASPAPAEAK